MIHPAISTSSPITATLSTANITVQHGTYKALSYTWGGTAEPHAITVNGFAFFVTPNLREALQHLRHDSQGLTIWIDSIRIDQVNPSERSEQVSMMNKIYSSAGCVRIWIGNASLTSERAMNLVQCCVEAIDDDDEVVRKVIDDQAGAETLTELLRRPYWTRTWIFQEIVLFKKATVHCGSKNAPWSGFQHLDRISGDPSKWPPSIIRERWILELRRALFSISQFCMNEAQARNMIDILVPTRRLKATDPRDKLFGLLGVADFSILLTPTYFIGVRELYVQFTRDLIRYDQDLAILLTAGRWNPDNGEDIDLPSWTPDFRGAAGLDVRYLAASYLDCFQATPTKILPDHLTPWLQQGNNWLLDTLIVNGIILDTVKKCIRLGKGSASRKTIMEVFQPWELNHHHTGKSYFEMFFETVIFEDGTLRGGDTEEARRTRKQSLSRLALGFLHECREFFNGNTPEITDNLDFLDHSGLSKSSMFGAYVDRYKHLAGADTDELHRCWQEYVIKAEGATDCSLTSIFSTKTNYLGRGLTTIEKGDVVALLFGCKLPVVLRPREGQRPVGYQLISPCYVSGVMFGEMMSRQLSDSQDDPLADLELHLV
ncbi:HET domain-containing protein [Colletotrichum musicola]|uniref:HET domain-containing protein n=1 Tax=Colletotrichum musicola TaxID=2175873 RepID=A0A8H6IZI2_9PEZI|nr:HET domain-containing protein [Colletotrichum musicola]